MKYRQLSLRKQLCKHFCGIGYAAIPLPLPGVPFFDGPDYAMTECRPRLVAAKVLMGTAPQGSNWCIGPNACRLGVHISCAILAVSGEV